MVFISNISDAKVKALTYVRDVWFDKTLQYLEELEFSDLSSNIQNQTKIKPKLNMDQDQSAFAYEFETDTERISSKGARNIGIVILNRHEYEITEQPNGADLNYTLLGGNQLDRT